MLDFDCFIPSLFSIGPEMFPIVQESHPLDDLLAKCWKGLVPTPVELKYIIEQTSALFEREPNVLELEAPINICGDIHGQFDDLLEIFKTSGIPPYTHYLFLGDYVDRGTMSIECLVLLCVLKMKYPDSIHLLRGNHESMEVSSMYGFKQEVLTKYKFASEYLFEAFEPLFNSFPIAAVISDSLFCVHGGISADATTIKEINQINRFQEIPMKGSLTDLLWSDPFKGNIGFAESKRNAGIRYGEEATTEFLEKNKLDIIVRAHEVVAEGFEYCQNDKVLTIFSATNHEPSSVNKAAILVIDEYLGRHIIHTKPMPHMENTESLINFVY